jgi:polyhydroxybutyrate depolymerase
MRRSFYLIFILILAAAMKLSAADIKDEIRTFEVDGRERNYFLHLPENVTENAPLVFVFHGYGGSAKGMIRFSGMNEVADKNGFAVCYPQAFLGDDNKNSWNAGYSNPEVDDVKFLSSLAVYLRKNTT